MNITGTQSEENVKMAFALESQARNRYTYFASKARLEGQDGIAELFESMADNEREHAKVWYKLLSNGIGESIENLEDSARCEQAEWESMYPDFAKTARAEGLELLAIIFDNIAAIEKNHELLFRERIDEIVSGKCAQKKQGYMCKNCGHVSQEKDITCPVCGEAGTFIAR